MFFFAAAASLCLNSAPAAAWGCEAHQAIAIAAARMLPPVTVAQIDAVLRASPVDPALRRFCDPPSAIPLGDAATWADDYRSVDATTGDWHFINFPRAAAADIPNYRAFCPHGRCVVDAIVTHYRTLVATKEPAQRGMALRFITHLVADLHQPLHAITNGDRGGNCFPVNDGGGPPQEDERHNWRPNLHALWDVELPRALMQSRGLAGADDLARLINAGAAVPLPEPPTAARVADWARAANALARNVAYGHLPVTPPIEPASAATLASCEDNRHVGRRMAALGERITASYRREGERVVLEQLRLAARRLASMLAAAFKS